MHPSSLSFSLDWIHRKKTRKEEKIWSLNWEISSWEEWSPDFLFLNSKYLRTFTAKLAWWNNNTLANVNLMPHLYIYISVQHSTPFKLNMFFFVHYISRISAPIYNWNAKCERINFEFANKEAHQWNELFCEYFYVHCAFKYKWLFCFQ